MNLVTAMMLIAIQPLLRAPESYARKNFKPPSIHKSRMDNRAFKRAQKYEPIFTEMAKKHKIPRWLLLGVAMQESNITSVKSWTNDWGIMQIHCGRGFSFLPFLRKNGIKIHRCKELMNPRVNIEAGAIILSHAFWLERKYKKDKRWLLYSITRYNAGNWRKKNMKPAGLYEQIIVWYGTRLERCLVENICRR